MQIFCGTLQYFQKILDLFFAHENIKKNGSQKLLIIGPKLFFRSTARQPKPAQNWFFILLIKYVPRLIFLLICALYTAINVPDKGLESAFYLLLH